MAGIQKSNKIIRTGQQIEGEEGEYVPVNKGHFELDTPERIKVFHEILSQGWEDEYKLYRSEWASCPREKNVRDYPLLVDIEMASSCNLACPMCYTTTDQFKENVPLKLMDFGLYKKVIDEIAGKVYAVRLSLRGEPTLHKNLIDAVRYAKMKGIREVSFLTNGSKLTLEYFKQLAHSGTDWITVSFDGIGEEYDRIRKPLKFEETLKKLKDIKVCKDEMGWTKPVVKVQGVWPAIQKDPEGFYNILASVSDLVAFNPLIDYLHNDSEIEYEQNFSCPWLYQRMGVTSNGYIPMCGNDEFDEQIIGNAWEHTIHEMWNGEQMKQIREKHAKPDGFLKYEICKRCYYPRKTEVDERAVVNGREINVLNYTNRVQKIGK